MLAEQTKDELITEVKRLLARIAALELENRVEHQARLDAEEESERKTKALAATLHELRNPLTAIVGHATTLLATDVLWSEADQNAFILIIADEAEKMGHLLEEFIEIARSASYKPVLHTNAVTLQEIIAIAHAQLTFITQHHKLCFDIQQGLSMVGVDAQRIAQVLVNLVKNAVQYSPLGSTITICAIARGAEVAVEVIDEGPGIPEHARAYIFEPFRQVQDGHQAPAGMGLGLSIAKAIVEAHRGRIWVADHDKPGAKIMFTIPLAVTVEPTP